MSYVQPQCDCSQHTAAANMSVEGLANKVNQVHQQLTNVHQGLMDTHQALKEVNPEMASQVEQHVASLANVVAQNKQVQKHAGSLMSMLGTAAKVAQTVAVKGGRRHKSRRNKRRTHKKTMSRRRR